MHTTNTHWKFYTCLNAYNKHTLEVLHVVCMHTIYTYWKFYMCLHAYKEHTLGVLHICLHAYNEHTLEVLHVSACIQQTHTGSFTCVCMHTTNTHWKCTCFCTHTMNTHWKFYTCLHAYNEHTLEVLHVSACIQ